MLALELGTIELSFRRHARTIRVGDGGGTIEGAALNFFHLAVLAPGSGEASNDETVMEEDGVEAEDGGFLAAVLLSGSDDDGADLADKLVLEPQTASGIEEGLHLSGHHAEASGGDEDDAVVVSEFVGFGDGDVSVDLLGFSGTELCDDFGGECLGNTLEGDFSTFDFLGAFDGGSGHAEAVTVGGVEENEDLDHF